MKFHFQSCADEAAEAEEQCESGGGLHEAAVALERGKPVRDDLLCIPPHPCFQDSPSSACECPFKINFPLLTENSPFLDSVLPLRSDVH